MTTKEKLRIAFVTQPFYYTSFPKPSESIGIVTSQMVRRLAENGDVIVYTPAEGRTLQKKTESYEGVSYQYLPTLGDLLLLKIVNKIPGIFNAKNPNYASRYTTLYME